MFDVDTVAKWDSLLKQGEVKTVRDDLLKLGPKTVPASHRYDVARICHSCGMFTLGLKLLAPLVSRKGEFWQHQANVNELTMYGVLLQRYGVVEEAMTTLAQVDPKENPKTLLYQAFCYFNKWEYTNAKPLLEEYVTISSLSDYEVLVGEVNLLSCLVTLQENDSAHRIFSAIKKKALAMGYKRLYANCLELISQVSIEQGQLNDARNFLDEAHDILRQSSTRDLLFVHKWLAYLKGLESQSKKPLQEFKDHSMKQGHWESVRAADTLSLDINFDNEVYQKVIFGTPHKAYVDKLMARFPDADLPKTYILGSSARILDVETSQWCGRQLVKEGGLVHQLLMALNIDFYSPQTIGSLYSKLYSGEHFDIYSSPKRVHQLINRLREVIFQEKLPINIRAERGFFHFEADPKIGVQVTADHEVKDRDQVILIHLRKAFADQPVSRSQIMKELNMTTPTAVRCVRRLVEKGVLEKSGQGRSTTYKLVG